MGSSAVSEILKAWKEDELEVFGYWASGPEKTPLVSISFEGKIFEANVEGIGIRGDDSGRVPGTPRLQAFFSLEGALPSPPDPRRLRFNFSTGAILDLFLG